MTVSRRLLHATSGTRRCLNEATVAAQPQSTGTAKAAPAVRVSSAAVARGTASILRSRHHQPTLQTYGRQQLQANFFGPREWYQITMRRRNRLEPCTAEEVAPKTRYDKSYPVEAYPQRSETMSDEQWAEYRRLASALYPGSPFDWEQRIFDGWQELTKNEPWTAEHARHRLKGGVLLKQFNQFPFRYEAATDNSENFSKNAHDLYMRVFEHCSPYFAEDGKSLEAAVLKDFVAAIETESDLVQLLPQVLKRWRWVQMGGRNQHLESALDEELSGKIIEKCLTMGEPSVAVHLLRYKSIYALPATTQDFEQVMLSLLVHHLQQQPYESRTIQYNPSRDTLGKVEEDEARAKQIATGKRRIPKRLCQFRGVPRFYYYNAEPAVLMPENSPLDEFAMPSLPVDADTKRLMPDDQRKKLYLMILERRRAQHAIDSKLEADYSAEGKEWARAMDDLARVYYFATSQNPRFYGLQSTPFMNDMLSLAGLTQSEESQRRADLVFSDAQAQQEECKSDSQLLSNGGLASHLFASANAEKTDQVLNYAQKNYTQDRIGLSALLPFMLSERRMDDYIAGGVRSLPTVVASSESARVSEALRSACIEKMAPHIMASLQKQVGMLGAGEDRMKLQQAWQRAVETSGASSTLMSNPQLNSVWTAN